MFNPIKVIDLELSRPPQNLKGLKNYMALRALVRLYNTPIGYVTIPIYGDCCSFDGFYQTVLRQHSWRIVHELLYNGLTKPLNPVGLSIEDLTSHAPSTRYGVEPLITVAVCTRNRTEDLVVCLESLIKLDYPAIDLLVIDNAPSNDRSKKLVQTKFPNVRYVLEPRPGLDWARNRAIIESQGEIIAYTDDDVVVDPHWVSALTNIFTENDEIMAVTGLVAPYELETRAQILFEKYGGFGRGFERKWYRLDGLNNKKEKYHIGAGQFGTGANMAFRRSLFDQIGHFDPALDVGTVTNGGGDLDMFFRVLQEGHTLVYEPRAIVYHRHRKHYEKLREQITNNGIGFYSYLVRNFINYRRKRYRIACFGLWWFCRWNLRRLLTSLIYPSLIPRDLILAECRGSLVGLLRYHKSRQNANKIKRSFGPMKKVTAK